jgi:hypothetical protein
MKYVIYASLLLLLMACQISRKLPFFKSERKIASIFTKSLGEYENASILVRIGSRPVELIPLSNTIISKIKLPRSAKVSCKGNYVDWYLDEEFVVYELGEGPSLKCQSREESEVRVEYLAPKMRLKDISESHAKDIAAIIAQVEKNNYENIEEKLKDAGLLSIFHKRIHYKQVQALRLKRGDYISLKYRQRLKQPVLCEDNNCLWVNGTGIDLDQLSMQNQRQVKYRFLPPYLLFCGGRYAAGDIWFRADYDWQISKVIDANGFNCEVNEILSDNGHADFEFDAIIIRKQELLARLLGTKEKFIQQKNQSISYDLRTQLDLIENYNSTIEQLSMVSSSSNDKLQENEILLNKRHVVFTVEPYRNRCKDCQQKRLVLSSISSRVSNDKGYYVEQERPFPLILQSFVIELPEQPIYARRFQICENQADNLRNDLLAIQAEETIKADDVFEIFEKYDGKKCDISKTSSLIVEKPKQATATQLIYYTSLQSVEVEEKKKDYSRVIGLELRKKYSGGIFQKLPQQELEKLENKIMLSRPFKVSRIEKMESQNGKMEDKLKDYSYNRWIKYLKILGF